MVGRPAAKSYELELKPGCCLRDYSLFMGHPLNLLSYLGDPGFTILTEEPLETVNPGYKGCENVVFTL